MTGFRPLEQVTVSYLGPAGIASTATARADATGTFALRRQTSKDSVGTWNLRLRGDAGTRRDVMYDLAELEIATERVVSEGTTYHRYRTPEANVYLDPALPAADAVVIAQFHRDAETIVLRDLDFQLNVSTDFYLVPNPEALAREVRAGGGDLAGYEAGLSLLNFKRAGVYLDMSSSPLPGFAHIVAHEFTHQVQGRIEGNRTSPTWFREGHAEYEGFKFGIAQSGDYERSVRRHARSIARKAALDNTWRPLESIGAFDVWETADTPTAELLYAEAFATVDYVARTFGEQALRPLLDGLADAPNDIDSVFRRLFNLTSLQLQDRVRQDVAAKDAYEQSIDALVAWAKLMLA
ncbi:MAG: hypothetical protein HY261_02705, partial [Chloroflexi bacterium]|nr:hypothetical protein [Chloroflexota bacterium]